MQCGHWIICAILPKNVAVSGTVVNAGIDVVVAPTDAIIDKAPRRKVLLNCTVDYFASFLRMKKSYKLAFYKDTFADIVFSRAR